MSKVKNVIKGNISKFDIIELTIIENYKVLFSGIIENFLNVQEENSILYKEKTRILETECKHSDRFNNKKLFLFI